ncbi:MAG: biopolymer transporter ExbD [Pirellulaceae bacterium]|nr:biopolymer transporter ExbD [Planctomycetaceae bacterium]
MKVPSSRDRRGGDIDATMTPMIDVVFLLLIFFVWTASFHLPEFALPTSVTTIDGVTSVPTDPPPEQDFEEIVVRVQLEGGNTVWQINDQPQPSLAAVRDRLQQIASINPDVPIIIHPDDEVEAGDAIDAYDMARLLQFTHVALATSLKPVSSTP